MSVVSWLSEYQVSMILGPPSSCLSCLNFFSPLDAISSMWKYDGGLKSRGFCEGFEAVLHLHLVLSCGFFIDAITVVFSPRPQLGDDFRLCSFHGATIQTKYCQAHYGVLKFSIQFRWVRMKSELFSHMWNICVAAWVLASGYWMLDSHQRYLIILPTQRTC